MSKQEQKFFENQRDAAIAAQVVGWSLAAWCFFSSEQSRRTEDVIKYLAKSMAPPDALLIIPVLFLYFVCLALSGFAPVDWFIANVLRPTLNTVSGAFLGAAAIALPLGATAISRDAEWMYLGITLLALLAYIAGQFIYWLGYFLEAPSAKTQREHVAVKITAGSTAAVSLLLMTSI